MLLLRKDTVKLDLISFYGFLLKFFNTLLVVFLTIAIARPQVFTGNTGAINNNGASSYFTMNVAGLPNVINSGFGVEKVCIDIKHTNLNDLFVFLVSPSGLRVELTSLNGGNGDNYSITCFNAFASAHITSELPPYNGEFIPEGNLGNFQNGQNPNGIWKLEVRDWDMNADAGTVDSWSVEFGNTVASSVDFSSSNLPIVIINTFGQEVLDEPKIPAEVKILFNGDGVRNYLSDGNVHFQGKIRIETRGSSSSNFAKRSYGFETIDFAGINIDTSFLGFPSENDFILYAPYSDKSLIRNYLSYYLANRMGRYASRTKFVELMVNGEYRGVYLLMEKIKRNKNRVNISKLDPSENFGDDLTGGYILKIDQIDPFGSSGFYSSFPSLNTEKKVYLQYHYPKYDNITAQQMHYIKSYFDSAEAVLHGPKFLDPFEGYRKYFDVGSFVDYIIISEISKNIDAYRLSTFVFKDKASKGGKLMIGPVWDFDLAWKNANYGDAFNVVGWQYEMFDTAYPSPLWVTRMMQDPYFTNALRCRWTEFRNAALKNDPFINFIDSTALALDEAQKRNFTFWPIMGNYVWPNVSPIPGNFAGEILNIKEWFWSRAGYIDYQLSSECLPLNTIEAAETNSLAVYPNPFSEELEITFYLPERSRIKLNIYDITGKEIKKLINQQLTPGNHSITFSGNELAGGIYFYSFTTDTRSISGKLVKK